MAYTAGQGNETRPQRPPTHNAETGVGMSKMTVVTVSNNPPNVISFYLISLFQERSRTASVCPSAEELCNNCFITFCIKVTPVTHVNLKDSLNLKITV